VYRTFEFLRVTFRDSWFVRFSWLALDFHALAITAEQKSAKKNQIYAALKRTPAKAAIFIEFLLARIVRQSTSSNLISV